VIQVFFYLCDCIDFKNKNIDVDLRVVSVKMFKRTDYTKVSKGKCQRSEQNSTEVLLLRNQMIESF